MWNKFELCFSSFCIVKSGCPDVASCSSLKLWIFAEKKSPNVSRRSTVGMELGKVLFFLLPDKWSVMWKRFALDVDGHIVVVCLQESFFTFSRWWMKICLCTVSPDFLWRRSARLRFCFASLICNVSQGAEGPSVMRRCPRGAWLSRTSHRPVVAVKVVRTS